MFSCLLPDNIYLNRRGCGKGAEKFNLHVLATKLVCVRIGSECIMTALYVSNRLREKTYFVIDSLKIAVQGIVIVKPVEKMWE